ncbi:MAG: DUF805 domain-containing protein [Terracidiphilus sp.]
MDWYLMVWKKYAEFSERSRRKEYWTFTLVNCLFCLPVYVAGLVLKAHMIGMFLLVAYGLYCLAGLIPGIAVYVRRMHDTGRSGWWWLIALIPIIGSIILLVFLVSDSEAGTNKYGPNPKLA